MEKLTPGVFAEVKGSDKAMCANVDMYSGLVYRSLNIHPDLFTPLFAVARMAGLVRPSGGGAVHRRADYPPGLQGDREAPALRAPRRPSKIGLGGPRAGMLQ